MDTINMYIDIDPELTGLLNKQGITLEQVVQNKFPHLKINYGTLPEPEQNDQTKDVVPIIIASSAAISAIIYAISKLLDTYYHRPHYCEWDELEEIKENDKIMKDKNGNPVYKVKRQHKIFSPESKNNQDSLEVDAGIKGVVLRVSSKTK